MKMQAFLASEPNRADRARGRLLEAALEIFGRQGPEGATVREIARAAGQNVASIAYYFGGKEELYHAVVEGIVRVIRYELGEVLPEMQRLRGQKHPDPAEAKRLFKQTLQLLYVRLLSRREAVPIAQLIVREQLGPTSAFEILYSTGLRDLHESLCFLVGTVCGRDPRDQEVIVRTHTLMGQVLFFAMSREAIQRRLGWSELGGKNAELVARVLEENLEIVLSALGGGKTGKARKVK